MAKNENESPDSGYDHFHEHGRKAPHQLAKGIAEKHADHSGAHTLGKSGKAENFPDTLKK